jgi:hypothetical protein
LRDREGSLRWLGGLPEDYAQRITVQGVGGGAPEETIMPANNIVIGQNVEVPKVQRAKELRQEMTPEERILCGTRI